MPSTRQKEIEELKPVRADGPRTADVNSLLQAIRASNISPLNSLHGCGKVFFTEGEPARGVYLLRTGRAAVSIWSSEGRVVMLRMAEAGDVLGLNSVLQGDLYDATVKTLAPCRTDFISRSELLEVMRRSQTGAQAILRILSRELTELTDRAKLLLLSQTVRSRLARLLLEWAGKNGGEAQSLRLDKIFTHEEIAQTICSSRETVTRLLATLRRERIIRISSDSIVILDRLALERMTLG
jgi:CRP/FNR family transcriptional regulator, cyclic AMP receptor protein